MLELVSETVDQEVDLDTVHAALAAILVRCHRRRLSLPEPPVA